MQQIGQGFKSGLTLPREIEGIIFDLDGTLIDTERLYKSAFFFSIARLGYSVTGSFYDDLVGIATTEREVALKTYFGDCFPVKSFLEIYYLNRNSLLQRHGVKLKRGASELVSFLQSRSIPRAIATSASRETTYKHLRYVGLDNAFSIIVTRDDSRVCKPDPSVFIEAARRLGVRHRGCLVIEDSLPGIRGAASAGMMPIFLADDTQRASEYLRACLAVVRNHYQIRQLLQNHYHNRQPIWSRRCSKTVRRCADTRPRVSAKRGGPG